MKIISILLIAFLFASCTLSYSQNQTMNIQNREIKTDTDLLKAVVFTSAHRVIGRWKYGTGFLRIRQAIKDYPTMEFNYQEQGNGFITELTYAQQKINTAVVNTSITEGLTEGLKSLLATIIRNPGIQAKDIPFLLENRPLKTIERQISALVKLQLIERQGSRKTGGYWFLKKT